MPRSPQHRFQHPAKPQREIDSALRALGSARPPEGMERRVHARLESPRRHFPAFYSISAAAVAAGVLIFAAVLNPAGRSKAQREDSSFQTNARQHTGQNGQTEQNVEQQIMMRPKGAFGAASAVHVPSTPIAVEPTPVGQRRGHTRSSHAIASASLANGADSTADDDSAHSATSPDAQHKDKAHSVPPKAKSNPRSHEIKIENVPTPPPGG